MAKFAFIVPPLTGHVNPTLSLGAELIQRGHAVGWITLDQSLKTRLPPGGELLYVYYDENDTKKKDNERYLDLIAKKNVYGIESIKFLYEDILIPLNRHMQEGIEKLLDKFQPDIVINDHQLFAGAIAAYKKNIPYATSVTAPAAIKAMEALPKIHAWETDQIITLQHECGVAGEKSIVCSDQMTLVFTSREFFGAADLPSHYKFVGPVTQNRPAVIPFDWATFHEMGNRPKILISIGTTFDHVHKKEFFTTVAEALKDEPILVVVVSDNALIDEWPENFLVQSRVPQLELLPCIDAVVCHAGHNTVCETLMHGLPLVVIPIAYDQSHVAGLVVQSGSGIRLNFKRFKAEHLRNAVREILRDAKYKNAAEVIQESFQESGGAERAAMLLEGMAAALRRRVLVI